MAGFARANLAGLALLAVLGGPQPGVAQDFLTQQEALRLAFPEPATVERRTAFLSDGDRRAAQEMAGSGIEVEQSVVTYYLGQAGDSVLGVAYFDLHRVRTLPEVLMIVVNPAARIERIEVLKFSEPPEYVPPGGWLERFEGRELDAELSLKGGIVNITGATLTSRAVTGAARRVLALHRVIRPLERERGGPTP